MCVAAVVVVYDADSVCMFRVYDVEQGARILALQQVVSTLKSSACACHELINLIM